MMKKLHFLAICLGFTIYCHSQAPQAFKYQAVIRDTSGTVIADQSVSLIISIIKENMDGEIVYSEMHDIYTNNLGIINLEIGRGAVISGDFTTINWGQKSHFISLEVSLGGGSDYIPLGTSQLLSVPYALFAAKSGSATIQPYWEDAGGGIYYNGGNVGIGTSSPDNSALLDVSSLNKGLLTPRMSREEILAIPEPANGLLVFNTTDDKFYAYVNSAGGWKQILFGEGILEVPFPCGDTSLTINHLVSSVVPVAKTVTYGTVNGIPGEPEKCWITHNLGADHPAASVDDATEASAGWYWQFNRMQGYMHDGTNRTPNTNWFYIDEDSDWESKNDPCKIELGEDWRVPTRTEWVNLDEAGNWTNWNGPWNSKLKLHAGGYIGYLTGNLQDRGIYGSYSGSVQSSTYKAWWITFGGNHSYISANFKSFALNIRCIRE